MSTPTQKKTVGNRYVVSMLIRPLLGEPQCEARGHEKPHAAFWEGRFYENMLQTQEWMRQGKSKQQIIRRVWSALCQEQETSGVVCHVQLALCFQAVEEMLTAQVNAKAAESAIKATMASTILSGKLGTILCLADHKTQQPFIALYPRPLVDADLLPLLNSKDLETEVMRC